MINYIMSWYCTENIPRLIERPWWKFWGHDTLVLEQKEVRKVIGMTAAEGRAFERFWNQNPDCLSVFGKLMGNNTKMVQLEIGKCLIFRQAMSATCQSSA